jgi:hypothetical protein
LRIQPIRSQVRVVFEGEPDRFLDGQWQRAPASLRSLRSGGHRGRQEGCRHDIRMEQRATHSSPV